MYSAWIFIISIMLVAAATTPPEQNSNPTNTWPLKCLSCGLNWEFCLAVSCQLSGRILLTTESRTEANMIEAGGSIVWAKLGASKLKLSQRNFLIPLLLPQTLIDNNQRERKSTCCYRCCCFFFEKIRFWKGDYQQEELVAVVGIETKPSTAVEAIIELSLVRLLMLLTCCSQVWARDWFGPA